MIHHIELGKTIFAGKRKLKLLIRNGEIVLGGNRQLKIYGTLSCKSGKRMKKENRVFFISEKEALDNGYRPCGHCMKKEYQKWKNGFI
jgi:methylphosphotriester-DNA--protein-cysteine methyltransferase